MAHIFLDTNYFIDVIHRDQDPELLQKLRGHTVFISPLSLHIFCYVYSIKTPNDALGASVKLFEHAALTKKITHASLQGPTNDFEDNVQLHSCASAECEVFLTKDKKLLALTYFGKARIYSPSDWQIPVRTQGF